MLETARPGQMGLVFWGQVVARVLMREVIRVEASAERGLGAMSPMRVKISSPVEEVVTV